ncbi:serine/threonine-protein kinase [Gracilibacillus massiliensis]|uniref:serine/threonine-protein kinase n=1 Tax=Gracilibacillus massiliensis TaxID=1564956 RepID=UPI00071CD6CD|nr:serine/threonine-protein kinase [Gracilibacillus massiliensis]
MLQIGKVVDGRYEILKEIGRGGMSIVYLAMDNRLKKSLVVKDIRKRQSSNHEVLLNSLVVEANMLKKLEHPALPRIYDIIETKDGIYVVMDYIEGESLKEKLDREYRVPPDDVIEWAKQLADVLGYLHNQEPHPIIYRDMKPDNVMLTPDGKIKLVDFGIAREYKTESSTDTTNLGTKAYAAPEQIAGKQTDRRTDIYSLGVTLYHLVTGKSLNEPPFEIRPIRTWDPTLPEGLEYIIQRCTQVEPEERYQQVEELYVDLNQINKLTQGYKKQLTKKLAFFLLPSLLFLGFTGTAVFGYNGVQKVQYQDYMGLISEAENALIEGEETEAKILLEKAISLDSGRAQAYNRLLDFYVNRGETEKGLAAIESNIDQGYGGVDDNDEVLFYVGMTYFDVQKDYNNALKYFRQVDEEEEPEAQYYKTLASTMSELNIDFAKFVEELENFEQFNDSEANNRRKVENYNALANIYLSYKGQIEDANTKAIDIINKAQSIIEILDQDELTFSFEENFERKLAQAYYSRGIQPESQTSASEDFYQAIDHYNNLLLLDVEDQEDIMITIGSIYHEIGENAQAVTYYQEILQQYPNSISSYVKLINLLIDMEQDKEEDKRNYDTVRQYYQELMELDEIKDNSDVEKLERRLQNNSVI